MSVIKEVLQDSFEKMAQQTLNWEGKLDSNGSNAINLLQVVSGVFGDDSMTLMGTVVPSLLEVLHDDYYLQNELKKDVVIGIFSIVQKHQCQVQPKPPYDLLH